MERLGEDVAACCEAGDVLGPARGVDPAGRDLGDRGCECRIGERGGELLCGGGEVAGERPQRGVVEARQRGTRVADAAVPRVVPVERRAVIDQPQLAAAPQEVRIAHRAVDVGDEHVERDDLRGERGIDGLACGGVEAKRGGEEVEAEVVAFAGDEQVVDLRISVGEAEAFRDREAHELGDRQAGSGGERAGDHLGYERTEALPGRAELGDPQRTVGVLDETRQRTALAERQHVTRGSDRAHHFFLPPLAFFLAGASALVSAATAPLRSSLFDMPSDALSASMRSMTLPVGASGVTVISWPSTFLSISSRMRACTSSTYFCGSNVSCAICWMICFARLTSAGLDSGSSGSGTSAHGFTSCAKRSW